MAYNRFESDVAFVNLWVENKMHEHFIEEIVAQDLGLRQALRTVYDLDTKDANDKDSCDQLDKVVEHVKLIYNIEDDHVDMLLNACESIMCEIEAE